MYAKGSFIVLVLALSSVASEIHCLGLNAEPHSMLQCAAGVLLADLISQFVAGSRSVAGLGSSLQSSIPGANVIFKAIAMTAGICQHNLS